MEFLLDLRTGDRGGATIRTPSTQVAAQLAGIVLEARETTLADFTRAVWLIEPAIIELVASRDRARRRSRRLRQLEAELDASIGDTGRFLRTWEEAAEWRLLQPATRRLRSPRRILRCVRVAVVPALTADVTTLPSVTKSNRKAHAHFVELVSAMAAHDSDRARDIWASIQELAAPFVEETELGRRLVIDLVG